MARRRVAPRLCARASCYWLLAACGWLGWRYALAAVEHGTVSPPFAVLELAATATPTAATTTRVVEPSTPGETLARTFTGENVSAALATLASIGASRRWLVTHQHRWNGTSALLSSRVEQWRWTYEPLAAVADRFYDCEIGRRNATCHRKHFCTVQCALDSQLGYGKRDPLLCEGQGLYARFSFLNPARKPHSFMDFVHAMNKSAVRILVLGDSLAQQLAVYIECHLARANGVRLVDSRAYNLNYTGWTLGRKRHYTIVRRTFVLAAPRNVSLDLVFIHKYRVPFANDDILYELCLKMDYIILLTGAHYEADNEHGDFAHHMLQTFRRLKACAQRHPVHVAFVTHAPHRFNATKGWWQNGRRRVAADSHRARCVLISNATIEEADWTTPVLKRAARRAGAELRIPHDVTSTDSSLWVVHYIPLFDFLFDVPGFNYFGEGKKHDCLHQAYFPDLMAGAMDYLFLSLASPTQALEPGADDQHPDPSHLPALLDNYARLDATTALNVYHTKRTTHQVATASEFAQAVFWNVH